MILATRTAIRRLVSHRVLIVATGGDQLLSHTIVSTTVVLLKVLVLVLAWLTIESIRAPVIVIAERSII